MTESKKFNRVATIVLVLFTVAAILPILLIVLASFTEETTLIRDGYSFFPKQ
jgi:putative aldouronate transport system permease protein